MEPSIKILLLGVSPVQRVHLRALHSDANMLVISENRTAEHQYKFDN